MATVYLGRLRGPAGFSRTVACKRLHPHLARSAAFRDRFLMEARLAARIRHSNVVSIIDVVQDADDVFLVMEYVLGIPLSKLLGHVAASSSTVPPPIAAGVMVPVLRGLHAAHETLGEQGEPLGLVHRDVSPQNVLVGADGVPRVLDFGIAKAAAAGEGTQDGVLKGKLGYLAPEQIRGEAFDRRVDIYAAGVVLWEMLVGERLFKTESAEATMRAILEQPVPAPGTRVSGIPPKVDAIVLQALARDPALRFPSAHDMADLLEAAVQPCTAAQLAKWVGVLAGDDLASLRARLTRIESTTDDPGPAPATLLDQDRSAGAEPETQPLIARPVEARTHPARKMVVPPAAVDRVSDAPSLDPHPARKMAVTPAEQAPANAGWRKLLLLLSALLAVVGGIAVLHRVAVSEKTSGSIAVSPGPSSVWTPSASAPSASSAPCAPHPLGEVVSITSGASARHTCALREDHSVWCWGANDKGQLGLGTDARDPVAYASHVGKLEPAVEVAAGAEFTVVVLGDTRAATWGKGLLPRPAVMDGLDDVDHLAAGQRHACAIKRGGSVLCWGDGERGQLGTVRTDAPLVAAVDSIREATAIAAGTAHTCAVVPPDGGVYCWGDNSFGQLGLGASDKHPHPLPTRVPAVQHMSAIAAGDKTTFAWSSRGDAAGWGFGIKRPVPLPTTDVVQIGAGGKHNCLVRKGGTVHCWGFNDFGQLGVASETDSAVPVQVPGMEGIRQVTAGDVHACALRADGRVVCWGGNEVGQLGSGTRDRERHATPTLVMVRGCP